MEYKKHKQMDYSLVLLVFLFMIVSCVSIYSAQKYLPYGDHFASKQLMWFIGGAIVTSVVYFFDFEQLKRLSLYIYIFGILTLIFLWLAPESIAPEIKGAKAWFSIPGFGSLQPSEFMKVFLILYLASVINDHNEKYENRDVKSDFLLLSKIGLVTFIPLFFIMLQPDAGTGMVIVSIMAGMLFISGLNKKFILSVLATALSLLLSFAYIFLYKTELLLTFMSQYQLNRIYSWLDPFGNAQGIGYQLRLSILSIGSGTITGKGFANGKVAVPEAHSDFIFTVIGEEFGFMGTSLVLCLYFILIYKIITISLRNKGEYEILIAAGVVSMLTFHIFENVGMVIGLVPITGIPLPLLSYGGSSLLGTLLALSIINNISATTNKSMFSND